MNVKQLNNPWRWLRLLLPIAAMVVTIYGGFDSIRIFGLPFRYFDIGQILLGCMFLVVAADRSATSGRSRIWFACLGVFFLSLNGWLIEERIRNVLRQEQITKLQEQFNITVTPLMRAAGRGDLEVMKKLLAQGADVQARNQIDLSALDYACGAISSSSTTVHGSLEAAQLLLDHGADVNAPGKYGRTPLMSAVRSQNTRLIKLMIERGADINRISNDGHSALFYAELDGSQEVVKLLKEHGAKSAGPGEGGSSRE